MPTQVDADDAERVGEPARDGIEEPRAQAVRVQQHERVTVAAPVEGGDAQGVALDDRGGRFSGNES